MNLPVMSWLAEATGCECRHFAELGLGTATDRAAFGEARARGVIIVTKDADFARLVQAEGPPPQVVWIRFGNTTNRRMQQLFRPLLPDVLRALEAGERLVEVTDV